MSSKEKEYCCKDFEKAIETLNFMIDESLPNKYWIDGYDMLGPYPPLNYCPSCGAKL